MTAKKPKQESVSWFFPSLKDDDGVPLPPHVRFVRHLTFNVVLATALILGSLAVGMTGYHLLEGLGWVQSFGHAAMILGGMGPYNEPAGSWSKVFEGVYAIWCGLLLIGVTGLILSPVLHKVMHQLNMADDETVAAAPKRRPRKKS
ncbi:MAG TPA: hypothetical protein VF090_02970 [Methyloceanibacter sp.]|jgi:hypothetical protein